MSDIGVALRIKYRLRSVPTARQATDWADAVRRLVDDGVLPDEAGLRIADAMFEIVPNLVIKAEADTIASLLARAREK